jgi:hypothetical protein
MPEKLKIKLTPVSVNGYTFTQEEKSIIKQDNSKRIIATMINNSSLNSNLKEMPELYISDKEHEEIAYNTVGRVLEKL